MKEYEYDPARGDFYNEQDEGYRYDHWVGGRPVEWPSIEPAVRRPDMQMPEQLIEQPPEQAVSGLSIEPLYEHLAEPSAAEALLAEQPTEQGALVLPSIESAELAEEQQTPPPCSELMQDGDQGWQPGMGAVRQGSLQAYRKAREPRGRFSAFTLAACIVVSSIFGIVGSYAYDRYKAAGGESGGTAVLYESVIRHVATGESADIEMTVIEAAAVVKQTVVEISVESSTRYGRIREGAGSGVILTQDGYVVTNHHVIEGAQNITVRLPNGQPYEAILIGSDSEADLAVLKIPMNGLTPAVLGDSSTLRVGQASLAVGNPLGELGGTVTSGIISALDREITLDGYNVMALLQTDAAVSPGNSGGGLFNLYGELIGVVNAKSTGVDIEGISFAIPINTAKKVIDDIITMGYVRGRVSTGLEVINVSSPREAMMYQVNQTGLYIAGSKDSRLHAGDRIIGVNDVPISSFADFKAALNKFKIGDVVNITVERGYERITADITLTELKQ